MIYGQRSSPKAYTSGFIDCEKDARQSGYFGTGLRALTYCVSDIMFPVMETENVMTDKETEALMALSNCQNRPRWAIKRQGMARRLNAVKLAHEIDRRAWWPEWENMFFGPTLAQAYHAICSQQSEDFAARAH